MINLKKEIQPEELKSSYCATVRAIDEYGRSETTAITVGFDGFFNECHKIVNFNGLQPFTFIPPQSYLTKPTAGIETNNVDTKYTSQITKLYRLPHSTTSSMSSTMPSTEAKTAEGETSKIDDKYRTTLLESRKHEYTKLIAMQEVSDSMSSFDLTSDSSSSFQLPSTVASDSKTDSESDLGVFFDASSTAYFTESDLNDRFSSVKIGSTVTANSVNFLKGKSYKKYITARKNLAEKKV